MSKVLSVIVAITIGVILIGSLAPTMLSNDHPGTISTDWVYDDYRQFDDGVTVSGNFEKLTYSGKTYVHANGVGDGTINGQQYTISKAPLEFFVLWGQSNAAYYKEDVTEVNTCPKIATQAYYFGANNKPLEITAADPLQTNIDDCSIHSSINPDGSLIIGNIDGAFESYYSYYCDNNTRPYILNVGVGGQRMEYFTAGEPGNTLMTEAITAALAAVDSDLFDVKNGCWIMSQGEANTTYPISTYIEEFSDVKNTLSGYNLNKGMIIQTVEKDGINSSVAQRIIVEEDPAVYWGSTATQTFSVANGLLTSDDKHYSQRGDNILGYDCANEWLTISGQKYVSEYNDLISIVIVVMLCGLLLAACGVIYIRRND